MLNINQQPSEYE